MRRILPETTKAGARGPGATPTTGITAPAEGDLSLLFHHRWAPAVLEEMRRGGGAKLVTLVKRLNAPRESILRTLRGLADRGLVRRNPGYGHPMRPEWVLTEAGERWAPACGRLLRRVRGGGLEEAVRGKWALPVLLGLMEGRDRFSTLAVALPGVTDRALALTLRRLEDAGAVRRDVVDDHPPRVHYSAAKHLRTLVLPLQQLATLATL